MTGLDYAKTVPGWMTEKELAWLGEEARFADSWTEIGVYCGRSFAMVALNLPYQALLQAVDKRLFEQVENDVSFADTLRYVVSQRPDLRISLFKDDINNVTRYMSDTEVCFIDADHDYEQTLWEITEWRGMAATVCGHDYNPSSWPGVVQAVDECGGKPISIGSIWVLP